MPKKRKLGGDLQALKISDGSETATLPASEFSHKQKKTKPKSNSARSLAPQSIVRVHAGKEAYIVDLAYRGISKEGEAIAAATSEGVSLFSVSEGGLAAQGSHSEHAGPVTAVRFCLGSLHCLDSCGEDGTVVAWDARQNEVAYRFSAPKQHLNCLDSTDRLLAAGGNGSVLFWDRRKASTSGQAEPMAEYNDTHEQEVTQVLLRPGNSWCGDTLLSASTDGLIAVHDISGSLDEDEGFEGALNVMDSVAGMGFYGAGGGKLWCRSHTESFYLWDWSAACNEESTGGEGPLASMTDAKQQLTKLNAGGASYEFLIGCNTDGDNSDKLSVVAGDANGDAAIFPLRVKGGSCKLKSPSHLLSGSHTEVVRKLLWTANTGSFLGLPPEKDDKRSAYLAFTGGEDGKLVAWS